MDQNIDSISIMHGFLYKINLFSLPGRRKNFDFPNEFWTEPNIHRSAGTHRLPHACPRNFLHLRSSYHIMDDRKTMVVQPWGGKELYHYDL